MTRATFTVPPPARPGPVAAMTGTQEGEQCLRQTNTGYCLQRLESLPDPDGHGCSCHKGHAPCGYCMTYTAACPAGCYRGEEA